MLERQAKLRERLASSHRTCLPRCDPCRTAEDGIYVDEVTQIGLPPASLFRSTIRARSCRRATRTISAGAMPLRSARKHARPDVPVLSINGDGGFLYTGNEIATAMRHRIPLVAVVFADGAFGNVRRIQQEHFGNRLIACDLANPDFVKFAESFGAAGRRARNPDELGAALRRLCRPRADTDRSAGGADALALGIHPHAARARQVKKLAMTGPDRVRLPGACS